MILPAVKIGGRVKIGCEMVAIFGSDRDWGFLIAVRIAKVSSVVGGFARVSSAIDELPGWIKWENCLLEQDKMRAGHCVMLVEVISSKTGQCGGEKEGPRRRWADRERNQVYWLRTGTRDLLCVIYGQHEPLESSDVVGLQLDSLNCNHHHGLDLVIGLGNPWVTLLAKVIWQVKSCASANKAKGVYPPTPLLTTCDGFALYALIFSTKAVEDSRMIACCFHHFIKQGQKPPTDGVYDVLATVVEARNGEGCEDVENGFMCVKLTGTIIDVCDILMLKPVSLRNEPELCYNIIPARLTVTGHVHSVNAAARTFDMTVQKHIIALSNGTKWIAGDYRELSHADTALDIGFSCGVLSKDQYSLAYHVPAHPATTHDIDLFSHCQHTLDSTQQTVPDQNNAPGQTDESVIPLHDLTPDVSTTPLEPSVTTVPTDRIHFSSPTALNKRQSMVYNIICAHLLASLANQNLPQH
ncbi:hypothetical protein EDB85DRAFT_1888747 [Lactarius pseudohatsudake]|nr:hypothetical protein EDB85DRAFT_1888747 [Lactarius pseudohatsudake]